MTTKPDLAEWNRKSLSLHQALLGAIAPNFRLVTLDHDGREWVAQFVLEKDDAEDREEIDDVMGEWGGFEDEDSDFRGHVRTLIEAGPMAMPRGSTRLIYLRRETIHWKENS